MRTQRQTFGAAPLPQAMPFKAFPMYQEGFFVCAF
jgi:hypothetical protein